jgi:purine-binding chemotaxis protein CheW
VSTQAVVPSAREGFGEATNQTNHAARREAPVLIVAVGGYTCAIPLHHVVETMRPVAIHPIGAMPHFVRGVSVIRGAPIPVIDLRALLENEETSGTFGRFVTLKIGQRYVAVGVDAVVAVRNLGAAQMARLPPLLSGAGADLVEAIGARDTRLVAVLHATRIVPDEIWAALAKSDGTP